MVKAFKITIITFAFLSCILPDLTHSAILLDRVVAVVDKEVITWSELYKMMEYESSDKMKALNEEERKKTFKDNEALFLDKLIDLKLQVQEAKRNGIEVSPEEVTEAIQNIKQKYSLTDTTFEESLKKEGLTLEEYKKRFSEQILVGHLTNKEIRNKIVVSDEEVNKFLEKNKEKFADSGGYRLSQIFFRKAKSDTEKKAIEDTAGLIIQKLKAGEDFSALAKEYSEDSTAKIGGDLGYIKNKHMAKEFIDVLSAMKAGDFSKPFWTDKGLHIIKLNEIVNVPNKEDVKENVRKFLSEEQFLEKYKTWVKGLREKAYIEIRL
jgi:peptidyl-prolyl cis-trans isomerase SurA